MKKNRKLSEEIKKLGLEEFDGVMFEESDKHVILVVSKKLEFVERASDIMWAVRRKWEEKREKPKEEKPGYIS